MSNNDSLDIEKLVLHRPPMLLLDRLVEASTDSAVAEVTIREQSPFFTPRAEVLIGTGGTARGGVPGWIGMEYMAQTVAALAGWRAHHKGLPIPTGYLLGTRHYRCQTPFFADGQRLRVEVSEEMFDANGLGAYNCRISAGTQLASARLTVYEKP